MTNKLTEELKASIRDEFVYGFTNDEGHRIFPTIDGLVKRHNVSRATLYRHVEKDEWQKQKNRYQTELQVKLDKERMEKMVDDGKRLDDTAVAIAQAMLQKVASRIRRDMKLEEENPAEAMDEGVFRELSQIAINAQKVGKLALGQAQEISKVSADVSNPEAFREVLDQLDEIAAARSSRHKHTLQ